MPSLPYQVRSKTDYALWLSHKVNKCFAGRCSNRSEHLGFAPMSHLAAEIAHKCVKVGAGVLALILLECPVDPDFLAIEYASIEAL